ncbi:hypothetical protein O0I10_006327 [Lichtheimia ornata]|uniref:Uncharacterized protein n=1 Tax=Lichtheimia ornata TaxID=688661 RepID=A0AAD7XZ01_9FUNG|nr:uncharacterized protein O0I10_006327 [Lichtheimia ornata]KAJ8658056.1 hypothetical protein O0I10_006327 [Lichtheimia ornata]
MITLEEILTACPNLISLTVTQYGDGVIADLPSATWPNISALSIELTEPDPCITRDEIIHLCDHFPSLKELHLDPCVDIESVLIIPQRFPLMTSVELEIFLTHVGVTYKSSGYQELSMTKLSVTIQHWQEDDDLVDMIPILRQHHETLEDIQWNIYPERDYGGLAHIQYPSLKKLSLSSSGSFILHNAPMLEELKMSSTAINADTRMLDTIPPRLKILEFDFDDGQELNDEKAIERYLHRISHQCLLQDLTIGLIDVDTSGNVLNAICGLRTLQRVVVGFAEVRKPYQMERFLEGLVHGCPHLLCLEIDCMIAPSTYSIDTLKRLERLKHFAFSINDTCGYDSFWRAIGTFTQLKRIHVYPENEVNQLEIERLKQQRPDMKIIVDDKFARY